MKIYLSASNQFDNLYNDGKHTEGEVCHLIGQRLKEYLEKYHDVKLGGLHDTMAKKVQESNAFGSDYHICIHTNAGGGKGTEVFCWPTNLSDKYVNAVYNNVSRLTPTPDRGIKSNTTFYEIKNTTTAKCIYIEVEFHDSFGSWIFENVERIAYEIAKAFLNNEQQFIELHETYGTIDEGKIYKVQCGAFTKKENAEKFRDDLKLKYGIDCFIVKG